jgi:hypothetical protein
VRSGRGLQCPDKDELAAVMKLLEEHRGDFWPDFIAVMLMAGARRGALGLRVRASGLRGGLPGGSPECWQSQERCKRLRERSARDKSRTHRSQPHSRPRGLS